MFYGGVIEGFYGRPWSFAQRTEMLAWLAAAGMNVFAYAPKDDVKLRACWRELYNHDELGALANLAGEAARRNVRFMVAIAPCLDIRYAEPSEIEALRRRIEQLRSIGVELFALLFDDIPHRLAAEDAKVFPSFAAAQCHVVNAAWATLGKEGLEVRLFFCPTEYCTRFAGGDVGKSAYLATIGAELAPEVEIFWTGPEIVSEEITAASLREVASVLQRKPVIWENFHANDYDIRRVHAGPLGGRRPDIRAEIAGFITNPNNEFEANFVAVHTTGQFVHSKSYDEREAAETAMGEWRERFRLANGNETLGEADVRLLMDLFYQPFRCGPQSERIIAMAAKLLEDVRPEKHGAAWRAGVEEIRKFLARVSELFDRMTELENRDLFYSFQPYLWDVREELMVLVRYLDWLATSPPVDATFPHEDLASNTYRRGFAAALQAFTPGPRSRS